MEKINNKKVKLPSVKGKSVNRVSKYYNYEKYPEEWLAQYNMLLPDGITCKNCAHSKKCQTVFDGKDSNTHCQFYPNRYCEKKEYTIESIKELAWKAYISQTNEEEFYKIHRKDAKIEFEKWWNDNK